MEEELVHKSFWWQWANDQELPGEGKRLIITITGAIHPGPAGVALKLSTARTPSHVFFTTNL